MDFEGASKGRFLKAPLAYNLVAGGGSGYGLGFKKITAISPLRVCDDCGCNIVGVFMIQKNSVRLWKIVGVYMQM